MNRIAKVLSQISDDMLMHYGVARRFLINMINSKA